MWFFSNSNMNDELIAEFLRYKSVKATKTIAFYRSRLSSYAGYVGDSWPPTPELITNFLFYCRQEKKLAQGSIHANYRALRAWCNWMYRAGHLKHNPIDHVDAPQIPRQKIPRAPKRSQVEDVFDWLDNEVEIILQRRDVLRNWLLVRNLAAFSILAHTGVRVGEFVHLTIDDINFKSGFVYVGEKGKDREERYIPLNEDCRIGADLRFWLSVREDILNHNGDDLNHVFISKNDTTYFKPLGIDGVEYILDILCEAAQVERFTPHALRHYYAVQQIRQGTDLMRLRDYMGHSSIAVTDIYLRSPDTWL